MNIFCDFHHASLLNSLIMLFEGRFRGNLYRPIGREWYEQGYWKIYDHPATVAQFLDVGGATPDGTPKLNETMGNEQNEVYLCRDIDSNKTNKAITLSGFMGRDFDFVIASIPQHIEPFRRLCDAHPSKPKLLFQIGNEWNIDSNQELMIDGILSSATLRITPHKPFVIYHQEFDTNLFKPSFENSNKHVNSFVNCFNTDALFTYDWQVFRSIEVVMHDFGWEFKAFGGQCRDGSKNGSLELSEAMKQSRFIWHTKAGGDGYGHIIHNAFAVGVPLIIRRSYYVGKLAEKLLTDDACIGIDGLSMSQIADKINYYHNPERYMAMSEAVIRNFKKYVDFDYEANEIRAMLDNLKRDN